MVCANLGLWACVNIGRFPLFPERFSKHIWCHPHRKDAIIVCVYFDSQHCPRPSSFYQECRTSNTTFYTHVWRYNKRIIIKNTYIEGTNVPYRTYLLTYYDLNVKQKFWTICIKVLLDDKVNTIMHLFSRH